MKKELKKRVENFFKDQFGKGVPNQLWAFLDSLIKETGEEAIFWEPLNPDFPRTTIGFPDFDSLKGLIEISKLFNKGWEMVLSSIHDWFEEAGAVTDIIIANKKAQERVQETISYYGIPFPGLIYWKDQESHPEDYRIFSSYPF